MSGGRTAARDVARVERTRRRRNFIVASGLLMRIEGR